MKPEEIEKAQKLRGSLYLGRVSNNPPMYQLYGAPGKYGEPCSLKQAHKYQSYIFAHKDKFDIVDGKIVEVTK